MVPTSKQKAAEITVRAIVMVLQLLSITGGALAIGLTVNSSESNGAIIAAGAIFAIFAVAVLVYEIFMTIFALKSGANHPARLLGDIVFNSVLATLTGLATILTGLAAIGFAVLFFFVGGFIIAAAVGPIVFGAIHTAAFIVSAIASSSIRKKLTNTRRATATNPMTVVVGTAAPPRSTTFVMVPQPGAVVGRGAGAPPGCILTVPADNGMLLPASGHWQEGSK